jgi:ribosomal protein S18 acetylase RimI-like enzyme
MMIEVRRGVAEDAPAVARVHVDSWQWGFRGLLPDTYLAGLSDQLDDRERMWRAVVTRPESRLWIAEVDRQIVGFCHAGRSPAGEDGVGELFAIYVAEEAAGRGVGQALMARALEDLRERGFAAAVLWVLDGNARARRFYERGGWVLDGLEKSEVLWGVETKQVRYRVELANRNG